MRLLPWVGEHALQVDLLVTVGARLLLAHDAPASDTELMEPAIRRFQNRLTGAVVALGLVKFVHLLECALSMAVIHATLTRASMLVCRYFRRCHPRQP